MSLSYSTDDIELLFKLIRRASTLPQLSDFLRERKLPYSAGSWDDAIEKRLRPAVGGGTITGDDLVRFLRSTEEYGRQHIFLYKCLPARVGWLMDRQRVREGLGTRGAASVLDQPSIVDWPSATRIVDARWEREGRGETLVVKLVEPRVYRVFVDEVKQGDYYTKRYAEEQTRAITVFQLHSNGMLELRIHSHKNTSQYEDDLTRMWRFVDPIFPIGEFGTLSLTKAKAALWNNRRELSKEVAFNHSQLRNQLGTVMTAATGRESANLSDDNGAADSLDGFLSSGGVCDALNVRFLREVRGTTVDEAPQPLRVMFPNSLNEFAITAQCTKSDYEWSLAKIIRLNQ